MPRAAGRAGRSRPHPPGAGTPSRGRTDGRAARSPRLRHRERSRRRRHPPARAVRRRRDRARSCSSGSPRTGSVPQIAAKRVPGIGVTSRTSPIRLQARRLTTGSAASGSLSSCAASADAGPAARELDERMLESAAGAEKRRPASRGSGGSPRTQPRHHGTACREAARRRPRRRASAPPRCRSRPNAAPASAGNSASAASISRWVRYPVSRSPSATIIGQRERRRTGAVYDALRRDSRDLLEVVGVIRVPGDAVSAGPSAPHRRSRTARTRI